MYNNVYYDPFVLFDLISSFILYYAYPNSHIMEILILAIRFM